jgi:hypothetical protein
LVRAVGQDNLSLSRAKCHFGHGQLACAALNRLVTEESASPAASPAPPGAGAEAGGAEVGTREAQRKRKHSAISELRADEVEVDKHPRQRTWMECLYGSTRSMSLVLGSTRDYIANPEWLVVPVIDFLVEMQMRLRFTRGRSSYSTRET